MITKKYGPQFDQTKYGQAIEYYGKSTDSKPVDGSVMNGAAFIEMDTGKVYLFDKSTAIWIEM